MKHQNLNKNPEQILAEVYKTASVEIKKDRGKSFFKRLKPHQAKWLHIISSQAESFKAVVTVLTTSLVKKIENPRQDVRFHKEELRGGYSGRTFDTKFITPFFKKVFRRFAMKESGWLTRSIEQPHPFTLKFPGKIRNKDVKNAFLQILNDVEIKRADPRDYLIGLFILLNLHIRREKLLIPISLTTRRKKITLESIVEGLRYHFFRKYKVAGASRLPVIAIYSIYQILLNDVARYQNKKLLPLKSHVASDIKSKEVGDIEILDKKGNCYESVEIKHNIPIDEFIIQDAYEKFKSLPIARYYLLTTAEPNIKFGREQKVKEAILKIRKEHGCEIIVNGIIPSLKYYLRLLKNPEQFIERYTENLKKEVTENTVIKIEHLKTWKKILKHLF